MMLELSDLAESMRLAIAAEDSYIRLLDKSEGSWSFRAYSARTAQCAQADVLACIILKKELDMAAESCI